MTRLPSLRRRRAADPAPVVQPPLHEPAATAPVQDPSPLPLPPEQTAVHTPVVLVDPSAPAGLEPTPPDAPPAPSFRTRGRLRRRLRYLRRVRELGFRDLGGLVFDLHRFGRDGSELVAGKLAALGTVDTELRALEQALADRQELTVLREPGVAACPRCAALHGTEASFCPNCGLHLSNPRAMAVGGPSVPGAAPTPVGGTAGPVVTAPAEPAPPATPGDGWAPDGQGSVRAADAGATPRSTQGEQPATARPPVEQPTTEQHRAGQPGPGPSAPA